MVLRHAQRATPPTGQTARQGGPSRWDQRDGIGRNTPLARCNSFASLEAQTVPGATCSIVVTYKSGTSRESGLTPKTADARGAVSWTWVIGRATTLGEWPIDVACEAAAGRFVVAMRPGPLPFLPFLGERPMVTAVLVRFRRAA
jgi:hypothetical protein